MPLELSSLETAVVQLERISERATDKPFMDAQDEVTRQAIQAGAIQHFEIVYELSWKFVQRWLRENRSAEEADLTRTRKDLFRHAAAAGLVADPNVWFAFGDTRNLASHTYNEANAEAVFAQAAPLAREARTLLAELQARND